MPIHIFHGCRDQRVPIIQSRKCRRALKNAGADGQRQEAPGLWHSLPWFPTRHLGMPEVLERYLANDCRPGSPEVLAKSARRTAKFRRRP